MDLHPKLPRRVWHFMAISSGFFRDALFPSHGMPHANAAARPCDATSIPAQGHGDMFQDGPWFLSGSVM